jgi:hypothetical protein
MLKERCQFFSAAAVEDQEAEIEQFDAKVCVGPVRQRWFLWPDRRRWLPRLTQVEEVYRNCIGQNEAGISTLQVRSLRQDRRGASLRIMTLPPTCSLDADQH